MADEDFTPEELELLDQIIADLKAINRRLSSNASAGEQNSGAKSMMVNITPFTSIPADTEVTMVMEPLEHLRDIYGDKPKMTIGTAIKKTASLVVEQTDAQIEDSVDESMDLVNTKKAVQVIEALNNGGSGADMEDQLLKTFVPKIHPTKCTVLQCSHGVIRLERDYIEQIMAQTEEPQLMLLKPVTPRLPPKPPDVSYGTMGESNFFSVSGTAVFYSGVGNKFHVGDGAGRINGAGPDVFSLSGGKTFNVENILDGEEGMGPIFNSYNVSTEGHATQNSENKKISPTSSDTISDTCIPLTKPMKNNAESILMPSLLGGRGSLFITSNDNTSSSSNHRKSGKFKMLKSEVYSARDIGSRIGIVGLGFVNEMAQVVTVAQFGVIFVFFALDLEISTTKLRVVRAVDILGAMVLNFLMERNSSNALHGKVTIGTLILQDYVVGLLFVSSLVHLLYGFYIFSSAVAGNLSQTLNEYIQKPKMNNVEFKEGKLVKGDKIKNNANGLPIIVLVHGIFGFDKGKLGGLSYFGGLEKQAERVLVPELGSLTSVYDRATKNFYYLKCGQDDFGDEHSKAYRHSQFGRNYEQGHYPERDENHPNHIIGHSARAQIVIVLQQLLVDHYKSMNFSSANSGITVATIRAFHLITIEFSSNCTRFNQVELLYGIAYSIEKITDSVIQGWMLSAPDENLHLPAPNIFIPTDLSLKNVQEKVKFPVLLSMSSYSPLSEIVAAAPAMAGMKLKILGGGLASRAAVPSEVHSLDRMEHLEVFPLLQTEYLAKFICRNLSHANAKYIIVMIHYQVKVEEWCCAKPYLVVLYIMTFSFENVTSLHLYFKGHNLEDKVIFKGDGIVTNGNTTHVMPNIITEKRTNGNAEMDQGQVANDPKIVELRHSTRERRHNRKCAHE